MWNPFRKNAKPKEPEKEETSKPKQMLPDFNGREDTQRVNNTLDGFRMKLDEAAEKLAETAEEAQKAAKKTSDTLKSLPAYQIPVAAKAAGTK